MRRCNRRSGAVFSLRLPFSIIGNSGIGHTLEADCIPAGTAAVKVYLHVRRRQWHTYRVMRQVVV